MKKSLNNLLLSLIVSNLSFQAFSQEEAKEFGTENAIGLDNSQTHKVLQTGSWIDNYNAWNKLSSKERIVRNTAVIKECKYEEYATSVRAGQKVFHDAEKVFSQSLLNQFIDNYRITSTRMELSSLKKNTPTWLEKLNKVLKQHAPKLECVSNIETPPTEMPLITIYADYHSKQEWFNAFLPYIAKAFVKTGADKIILFAEGHHGTPSINKIYTGESLIEFQIHPLESDQFLKEVELKINSFKKRLSNLDFLKKNLIDEINSNNIMDKINELNQISENRALDKTTPIIEDYLMFIHSAGRDRALTRTIEWGKKIRKFREANPLTKFIIMMGADHILLQVHREAFFEIAKITSKTGVQIIFSEMFNSGQECLNIFDHKELQQQEYLIRQYQSENINICHSERSEESPLIFRSFRLTPSG